MRKIAFAIPLGILLVLAACGQAGPPAAQPAPGTPTAAPTAPPEQTSAAQNTPQPATTLQPTMTLQPTEAQAVAATPSASPPARLVAAAQQRLAQHLGVSVDDLRLRGAEPKEWPDGSLGCPAPDQIYPQVITPGFLLVFSRRAQAESYTVHTGADEQQMVLCMNQQPIELGGDSSAAPASATPQPASANPDPASQALVELARQNLAQKLGIKAEDITLVGVEAVEWSDSSLGCPRPGMNYLQVITSGYRISLEAQGQRYEYHSDQSSRVVHCDRPGQ